MLLLLLFIFIFFESWSNSGATVVVIDKMKNMKTFESLKTFG